MPKAESPEIYDHLRLQYARAAVGLYKRGKCSREQLEASLLAIEPYFYNTRLKIDAMMIELDEQMAEKGG